MAISCVGFGCFVPFVIYGLCLRCLLPWRDWAVFRGKTVGKCGTFREFCRVFLPGVGGWSGVWVAAGAGTFPLAACGRAGRMCFRENMEKAAGANLRRVGASGWSLRPFGCMACRWGGGYLNSPSCSSTSACTRATNSVTVMVSGSPPLPPCTRTFTLPSAASFSPTMSM